MPLGAAAPTGRTTNQLAEGLAILATVNILTDVLSGRPRWAEMHPLNLTQVVLAEGRETGRAS